MGAASTAVDIRKIKKGDWIFARPNHYRGDSRWAWRRVTRSTRHQDNRPPHSFEECGVAVQAHGYADYWLKRNEIKAHVRGNEPKPTWKP